MRVFRIICVAAVLCTGLSFALMAQKKPNQRQPSRADSEQSKAPIRQLFEEMFTKGRYELQGQVFSNRCPVHFGSRSVTLEQSISEGKNLRTAAPDLVMKANQISVNGDIVTVAWTATGTHTKPSPGLKPTGKRVNMHGTSRFRVVDGKIVEVWNEEYRTELFRQLGVSKTAALMFETADDLWASATQLLPDRVYAVFQ